MDDPYMAAAVAYVRHNYTDYDDLLRSGMDRYEARDEVGQQIAAVIREWEKPKNNPRKGECPELRRASRGLVLALSDDMDDYPDASAYRQVMDRSCSVRRALGKWDSEYPALRNPRRKNRFKDPHDEAVRRYGSEPEHVKQQLKSLAEEEGMRAAISGLDLRNPYKSGPLKTAWKKGWDFMIRRH